MPTSTTDLWAAMLHSLPRDSWIEIHEIYQAVEAKIVFQQDDLIPSAPGNDDPTWHRNVRNILQRRKASDILWGRRGRYFFPSLLGDRGSLLTAERELRHLWWSEILDAGGPDRLPPDLLRKIGIYRSAQGIWVDKQRTAHLSPDGNGIAVGLLHTGSQYPDELDENALIYHYPQTNRPPTRDRNEVQAVKNAFLNQINIFIIVRPSPSSAVRNLHYGRVEDWNDSTKEFLVGFGQTPLSSIPVISVDDQPFSLTVNQVSSSVKHTARPSQARFRFDVIKRYGISCAVCDVDMLDLLDAVHIRPFSHNGSDDPRNGLVLCANHHRAFDAGLFYFNSPSNQILSSPDLELGQLFITVPNLDHLEAKPHPDAIKWHSDRLHSTSLGKIRP